ncbi:MAG: aminoacyl-tRNA hydrolase [Wenzhouxiangella sp.]
MTRWLIVGLGNPGTKYDRTRHNAGFWLLDALAARLGLAWKAERRFHGEIGKVRSASAEVLGLKPHTFMNESGQAVRAVSDYFDVPVERIVVGYDDLDLPPGTVRLKRGGGHGGHNGLRSLFAHLPDPGFWRVRIGIGHPGVREVVTPWVLGRPDANDERHIIASIDRAVEVLPLLLAGQAGRAMQALHTEPGAPADTGGDESEQASKGESR